jgi:3-phenylpropionate/trans-cinnamate dioxygenase ferredoxin component
LARIALSEVPENGTRVVEVEGQRVLLCRSATGIHAMDEMCPHQRLTMDGGRVRGGFIMCPHHGARFNLADGRTLSPLTPNNLKLYETHVDGDELEILL